MLIDNHIVLRLFNIGVLSSTFNFFFSENVPIPLLNTIINVVDEISVIFIFIITLLNIKSFFFDKLLVCLSLFLIVGIIGNISQNSSWLVVSLGALNTIKPIILFWCLCQYDFSWDDFHDFMSFYLYCFPIIVISYIFDIVMPGFRNFIGIKAQLDDYRIGLRCLGGLFSRYTYAVIYGTLYFLYFSFYAPQNHMWKKIFSVFMIIGGIRLKDIFAFIMSSLLLLLKQIKVSVCVIIIILGSALFYVYTIVMPDHYSLYFQSDEDGNVARVVLGYTSLKIATDYFPFGVGFGMFASPISRQYYSDIYYKYNINNVYGLDFERDGGMYMCDSFWPMIIGETGFIGTLLYILILYFAFGPFLKRFLNDTRNPNILIPSFLFISFLITSIGKPVFTGPPHSLILWGISGIFQSLTNKEYE